jgi:hypothetical protein
VPTADVPLPSPVPPAPATEANRKKIETGLVVPASAADAVKAPIQQIAAYQDLQLRAEPDKASDSAAPRTDPPRLPAAAQEPAATEKTPAQPLKSLSLEFTPDGAKDVRVRLVERDGGVHVSLHSTDPATTKNLRDGVTDLAGVLAHAGYDAKTWTSDRQRQDQPQQHDEEEPRRRNDRHGAGTESFDGILQQSV